MQGKVIMYGTEVNKDHNNYIYNDIVLCYTPA
jgi:hypothetical protein